MSDTLKVTVTTTTTKTFEIEAHELAERRNPQPYPTVNDLHSLAMDYAERLAIDPVDEQVTVAVDSYAAVDFLAAARRYIDETE
jgi:hypothetical protein